MARFVFDPSSGLMVPRERRIEPYRGKRLCSLVAGMGPAFYGNAAAPITDPFFANVVLLHNCLEANNSTTLIDSSSYGRTITALGDAKITTTSPPSGVTGSVIMDGTLDGFEVPNSTNFDFGSGAWTAEFFLNASVTPGGGVTIIGGNREASGATNGVFPFFTTGGSLVHAVTNAGTTQTGSALFTVTTNTWYHGFVGGDATDYYMGWGGTIRAKFAKTTNPGASNGKWTWGNWTSEGPTFNRGWVGKIGPTRVTKGTLRYTGAATTPYTIPTLPFPTS